MEFLTQVLLIGIMLSIFSVVAFRIGHGNTRIVQFDLDNTTRCIYRYWTGEHHNGKKVIRAADPIEIQYMLRVDEEYDEETDLEAYHETKSPALSGKICRATMRSFGVSEWDGEKGLTETELMALFYNFQDYLKKNGKNILPLPDRGPLLKEVAFNKSTKETTSNSSD